MLQSSILMPLCKQRESSQEAGCLLPAIQAPSLQHCTTGSISPLGCTPGWLWDKLDALQDYFSTSRCPCHVRNHHPEYPPWRKKNTFLDQFEHCFQNGHKYEEHPSSLPGHSLWQNWDVLHAREHRLYAAFQNLCNTAYYQWFCHMYLNRNVYGKIVWWDLRIWWGLWDTSAHLQWRLWERVAGPLGIPTRASCTASSLGPCTWEQAFEPRCTGAEQRSLQPCGLSQSGQ